MAKTNTENSQVEPLDLFKRSVRSMIKARYPYIWIQTGEELRVLKILEEIAQDVDREAFVWDDVQLWQPIIAWTHGDLDIEIPALPKMLSATSITASLKDDISSVIDAQKKCLLIYPDFHLHVYDVTQPLSQNIIRILKWLNPRVRASGCSLIFISNSIAIPNEIADIIHVENVRPPDRNEIESVLEKTRLNVPIAIEISDGVKEQMVSSALGLTLDQAERLFSLSIALNYQSPSRMVDVIVKGKKGVIAAAGALEFFAPNEVPDYLAGVDVLKSWLELRKDAYSIEAEKYKLPKPRGVLLMGIPGTGKSLTAKYIAGKWKMPLLRFDMGAVFGSLVGQTERSMRQALHIVEAIAPAVLWIDEIEKAISTGPDLDSGVSKRVLGSLLTWMQEKQAPVFVIATANDTSKLPPELMRKGRFDEIFFLDLPNIEERAEIFRVHVARVGRSADDFDIENLAEMTDGFVGAEIEQVIKEGLYKAFSDNHRSLKDQDLIEAIKKTKPLSKTKEDMINSLRELVVRQEVVLASSPMKTRKKPAKHGIELD